MKLWPLILAVVGLLFLALGVRWIHVAELPEQETWINAGGCHTPVTILDPPADVKPAGSVILLHGLSANRRLMMYLAEDFAGHGLRAFAIDLPGHGDSKDAFSFPRAQECATAVVESLVRGGTIDPNDDPGRSLDGRRNRHTHGRPRPRDCYDCHFARAYEDAAAHARKPAGVQRKTRTSGHEATGQNSRPLPAESATSLKISRSSARSI